MVVVMGSRRDFATAHEMEPPRALGMVGHSGPARDLGMVGDSEPARDLGMVGAMDAWKGLVMVPWMDHWKGQMTVLVQRMVHWMALRWACQKVQWRVCCSVSWMVWMRWRVAMMAERKVIRMGLAFP
jgi:hypothetical protein